MRAASVRAVKYGKKIRGLVLPGQADRYSPTAASRIHLEMCVKKEAITPMLQFQYVAYLEELLKNDAGRRPTEATAVYNKWLSRGLDTTLLQSTAACVGVTVIPPVPPIPCDTWLNEIDCLAAGCCWTGLQCITAPCSCSDYETQIACEAAGCFWYGGACHSVPPVCAWAYKMSLTFTGNISATNLDDFPVLVHLVAANFDFTHAKANGEDIRFMDTDICPSDGTPLKHEIEYWNQAGEEAWVWVKVPRIDGGSVIDFIYLFYGNPAAADGQDPPNVWNTNYQMVQHMYDDPDNQHVQDSTANAYQATKGAAGAPAQADAKMYKGQDYDGTDDQISTDNHLLITNSRITVCAWVRPTLITGTHRMVYKLHTASNRDVYIYLNNSTSKAHWAIFSTTGVSHNCASDAAVPLNVWTFITGTYDGTTQKIFINGAVQADAKAWSGSFSHDDHAFMGRNESAGEPFKGKIDEVRVMNAAMTTDWIKAQHLSMTDALTTYGAEQGT